MGETDELVVVYGIFSETSCAYTHSVLRIAVQICLRTIIFFEVGNELLRSAREFEFLGQTLEFLPCL